MKKLPVLTLTAIGSASLFALSTHAQLFSDNFDAGTSASGWSTKLSHSDAFSNFAFDYSTLGIPSAPKSTGGTTIGMNFLANQSAGVQQGVSASPIGYSFTGDFRIQFDMWLNYVASGNGSTQVGSFGWGTSGAAAQWAGSSSSIMFGGTTDGGSTSDYRLYRNNALVTTTSAYAAASLNNTATYYTTRYGNTAVPSAQVTLFPAQAGAVSPAGTLGFAWHDVVIEKVGTILTWSVDGSLIATGDSAGATLSGNNIFFGLFDINAGSSTDGDDQIVTAIYDNITVTTIPEPSSLALVGLGCLALLARRRK